MTDHNRHVSANFADEIEELLKKKFDSHDNVKIVSTETQHNPEMTTLRVHLFTKNITYCNRLHKLTIDVYYEGEK